MATGSIYRSIVAAALIGACLAVSIGSRAGQQSIPEPPSNAEAGFERIFDGQSLKGWEGDPKYWRVEDGCLVGEVTPATILKRNTFIIWRGGKPRDFELKVEYRISAHGNSGINYRSVEVPDLPLALKGYQADIDGQNRNANGMRYTAQNYEERGRGFLAFRGQMTHIATGDKPRIVASLGDTNELANFIKSDDWNEFHLVIRGNVLIHILNGHLMSVVIDDDTANRRFDGLIGVQVHVGPPMKVEFRNFRLKNLESAGP